MLKTYSLAALLFCAPFTAQHIHAATAQDLSEAFIKTAADAVPAVVYLKVENEQAYRPQQSPNDVFSDDFFKRFFGAPQQQKQMPQMSQGSGFFISDDGFIVTNYHVVKEGKKIVAVLQEGNTKEYDAEFIGGDPYTDIALLKINDPDGRKFPHLKFGDSDKVRVGELVIAVGSPFQLQATVSHGIISQKGRQNLQISDLEDFIQTDASINPGNSGGPLIDLNSRIIGMNTAIVSRSGGSLGIGFAVPSNIVKNIVSQLQKKGAVNRGFLGVSLQPIDKELAEAFNHTSDTGALVAKVSPDSPAEKAGVMQGDIVLSINGVKIVTPSTLRNQVLLLEPGTEVKLVVKRKGKKMTFNITLASHAKSTSSNVQVAHSLGISVDNLTPANVSKYRLSPDDEGIVVTEVQTSSLAYRAGLRPGVLIIGINHHKVTNATEFNNAIHKLGKGQKVLLLVRAGDVTRFIYLRIN